MVLKRSCADGQTTRRAGLCSGNARSRCVDRIAQRELVKCHSFGHFANTVTIFCFAHVDLDTGLIHLFRPCMLSTESTDSELAFTALVTYILMTPAKNFTALMQGSWGGFGCKTFVVLEDSTNLIDISKWLPLHIFTPHDIWIQSRH